MTTSIAERIRAARGDRQRAEVARQAGLDYSTIWRWETGKQEPTDIVALRKLADALDTTVAALLGEAA